MRTDCRKTRYCLIAIAGVLMALLAQPALAVSDIVISQVYGGGGNTGAPYTNDYIELFNRGSVSLSLAGWSLQYASATGTGTFGAATNLLTLLSGTLQPGQYLLVQEASGGAVGVSLPSPDIIDATPINMSATGAKLALVSSTTPLSGNGGTTPLTSGDLAVLVDLVGWDGADFFEGAAGPATTNTTALFRLYGGLQDTDNNSADFMSGAPNPRNSTSPVNAVPLPSTMLLLGSGLVGLGALRRVTKG